MFNLLIQSLARLLSSVFNPVILFLPIPYLVVLRTTDNIEVAIKWTFFSWIFIFSIAAFIYYQVKRGRFSNFDVSDRKDRPLLFSFVAIVSFIYISTLLILNGPISMILITIGIILGLVILDIINKYVKASIHVASVTCILLSITILAGFQYVFVLILIPFVAWSRVRLKRHTPVETIIGAIFGVCLTLFMYGIIKYVFLK